MKIETRNNLIIILVIAGLFGISVILFKYTNYETALYFSIIGIPLFFIFFAYHYIKNLRTSRPDPGLTLKTQEAEKIAYDFKNLHSMSCEMNRTYGLSTDDIEESLKTLAFKELPGIGINVVETEGMYAAQVDEKSINKVDLDSIDNAGIKIRKIDELLKNKAADFTNTVSQAYLSYVSSLRSAGFTVEPAASKLQAEINTKKPGTGSITECAGYLDSITSILREIVSSCIPEADRLKQRVKELGKDVSSIESEINNVNYIMNSRDYRDFEKGILSLTKTMKTLESSAGPDFGTMKSGLLSAIEKILGSVESKIENDNTQKLLILEDRIKKLGSAVRIHELSQIEPRIIPIANEIAKEVYETIKNNEAAIKQANFPQLFYPERQQFENEYSKLLNESNVRIYSENFSILLRTMLPIMEKSNRKARVISIYPRIENIIKSEIQTKGKVVSEVLKVRNAEEFMELYSYFHTDVRYDPFQKTLSILGTINLFRISVKITDDKNRPLAEAQIFLKRDDKAVKDVLSDKNGNAVIADMNKGSYNLIIKHDEHKTQTKKIELDKDMDIEIKMIERPPGEKLCKGKEEEMQRTLVKVKDAIQKEISFKKYVLSTFDLKVKPEIIPCLLYLWSKDNRAVKFIRFQKDFLVYDVETLQKEIRTLLENNLIPGRKESIKELTEGFISAPLPVEEITAVIEDIKKGSDHYNNIEYNSSMIWKKS